MTAPFALHVRHFSADRLRHYLTACGGDQTRAVELYRWNADLSGAIMVDLSLFEVAFRNALDERMVARHRKKNRAGDWLDDGAGELGRDRRGVGRHLPPYTDLDTARRRVSQNRQQAIHGQVISETTFGFWHQLVSRRQTFLWPDLAGAFPFAPNRGQTTVTGPVEDLRMLRNRISHHHRIWAMPWRRVHLQLLTLSGYIDPNFEQWIHDHSGVMNFRPQP